jgi:hypothetical protein
VVCSIEKYDDGQVEGIRKEAAVAKFKVLLRHLLEGIKKRHEKTSVRIVIGPREFPTTYLSNKCRNQYHLSQSAHSVRQYARSRETDYCE